MKNSKKGISLIVLIITIIVIVILATAILVSVISNNPISEANKARYESDRDNMQAVFTNTVGKIMAQNQGVVNITAGQINTETKDANEVIGEVAYTVDNAMVASNASGTIYFDKGENTATTYYTGKKLPIYAAGETKWYVDSEGILSLEVAGVKYGSGEIESGNGNVDETLAPGLYKTDGTFVSWEQLTSMEYKTISYYDIMKEENISSAILNVDENGVLLSLYVLAANTTYNSDYLDGKLVIDNNVKEFDYAAFYGCEKLTSIVIPDSVAKIGMNAFVNCKNLISIEIPDSITKIESTILGYTGITSITIPNSIASISDGAFYDCKNLTDIYYKGTMSEWEIIDKECPAMAWNGGCPEITVHCTDGDIVIYETT